jgi:hypothetical protein
MGAGASPGFTAPVGATDREVEIIRLWATGQTETQIAGRFTISITRARNIVWELRRKYGEQIVPYHRPRASANYGGCSGYSTRQEG